MKFNWILNLSCYFAFFYFFNSKFNQVVDQILIKSISLVLSPYLVLSSSFTFDSYFRSLFGSMGFYVIIYFANVAKWIVKLCQCKHVHTLFWCNFHKNPIQAKQQPIKKHLLSSGLFSDEKRKNRFIWSLSHSIRRYFFSITFDFLYTQQ